MGASCCEVLVSCRLAPCMALQSDCSSRVTQLFTMLSSETALCSESVAVVLQRRICAARLLPRALHGMHLIDTDFESTTALSPNCGS